MSTVKPPFNPAVIDSLLDKQKSARDAFDIFIGCAYDDISCSSDLSEMVGSEGLITFAFGRRHMTDIHVHNEVLCLVMYKMGDGHDIVSVVIPYTAIVETYTAVDKPIINWTKPTLTLVK